MSQSPGSALAVIQSIDSVPHILKLVAESTEIGFVCIAHVTTTSWTACAVYDEINFNLFAGNKLDVSSTLCDSVRSLQKEILIENAKEDPVYCDNPVPKQFGFQSYFSYPLYNADGSFFGTLCGLDDKPLTLKSERLTGMIGSFASLLTRQIADAASLSETQSQLNSEREAVALREQNIAILGHDLRTPLSSISMGLDVIEHINREPQVGKVVKMMRASSLRISRLISDVMDFAHTRVGQGVTIKLADTDNLEDMLTHVVEELRDAYPVAQISDDIVINTAIFCDAGRLCQLISNLLINALIHGDVNRQVTVKARVDVATLIIAVENYGATISQAALDNMFQPFWRLDAEKSGEGLGLGLFIASEISKAHNAELSVSSIENLTRFTLKVPVSSV